MSLRGNSQKAKVKQYMSQKGKSREAKGKTAKGRKAKVAKPMDVVRQQLLVLTWVLEFLARNVASASIKLSFGHVTCPAALIGLEL